MTFLKVLAAIELVGLVASVAMCLSGAAVDGRGEGTLWQLAGLVGVVLFSFSGVLLVVVAVLVAL